MTQLSPDAQVVLDAYRGIWADEPLENDVDCLVAAFRAAAMRTLFTAEQHAGPTPNEYELGWNAAVDYFQTIANELEGYGDG